MIPLLRFGTLQGAKKRDRCLVMLLVSFLWMLQFPLHLDSYIFTSIVFFFFFLVTPVTLILNCKLNSDRPWMGR
jgi:hypothetical protein